MRVSMRARSVAHCARLAANRAVLAAAFLQPQDCTSKEHTVTAPLPTSDSGDRSEEEAADAN